MVQQVTKLRTWLSPASSDAPYNQQGILMDFLGRGGIFSEKMSHMKGEIR
jgi:hypothetical protein